MPIRLWAVVQTRAGASKCQLDDAWLILSEVVFSNYGFQVCHPIIILLVSFLPFPHVPIDWMTVKPHDSHASDIRQR